MFVSVGASGISEAGLSTKEKTERTKRVLLSLVCLSTPAKAVSSAHEELMITNNSKLLSESAAYSGESEDYWHGEMASILRMLRESSPHLERLASLMETSVLSRTQLMWMLSELSDTEKSALMVTPVSAFDSNHQSRKEQQQGTERLEPGTHTHRELGRGLRQSNDFCSFLIQLMGFELNPLLLSGYVSGCIVLLQIRWL